MIGPTDLLHPSPAPHFKYIYIYIYTVNCIYLVHKRKIFYKLQVVNNFKILYLFDLQRKLKRVYHFYVKFPRIDCCEVLFSGFTAITQIMEAAVGMDLLFLTQVLR